jgi:hypothetical protein
MDEESSDHRVRVVKLARPLLKVLPGTPALPELKVIQVLRDPRVHPERPGQRVRKVTRRTR